MNREYHRWFSPTLQRYMELLVFGHGGTPVLVFPTSQGRFHDYEDRGMVNALRGGIEAGNLQLFCVDSLDAESWYNAGVSARWRVARHLQYEQYLVNEVLPLIKHKNWSDRLFTTGCSFGGYHAVNFGLRHPDLVDRSISLGGVFNIKRFMNGYYDDDVYFNNPVDFLPQLSDPWYLNLYRTKADFVLGTGEWDMCLDENIKFSRMLASKGVNYWLDVWGDHTRHDWPDWQRMIGKYLL
jgi:esterase/lipase superfamily enzyme